jgi:hypothetical protein
MVKKLFLILLFAAPTLAATPQLVQYRSGSNTLTTTNPETPSTYHMLLVDGAQPGNCIIVAFQWDNGNSPSASVTDDQGNSYVQASKTLDATNNQNGAIYYALNVAANTRAINVTLTAPGAMINAMSVVAAEFTNVATVSALDGNSGNFNSNASITAGSIAPGTSGDLMFQVAFQLTKAHTYTAGSQPNISWNLLTSDSQDGMASQWGVYSSTSAINPTFAQSASGHFLSLAIALKTATAGETPSRAFRIVGIEHESLFSSANFGPGYVSPTTVQWPTHTGNLLLAIAASGNSGSITGITDNLGNSWAKCGPGLTAGPHTENVFYAANPIVGDTMRLSVTSSSSSGVDSTLWLEEVIGAATSSPCDTSGSNSGHQTTSASSLPGPTIAPTASTDLIVSVNQEEFDTVNGVANPSGILSDALIDTDESLDGPENLDQNAGVSHVYGSGTSSQAVPGTWEYLSGTDPQFNWATYAAAFKSGTSVTPPAPPTHLTVTIQ